MRRPSQLAWRLAFAVPWSAPGSRESRRGAVTLAMTAKRARQRGLPPPTQGPAIYGFGVRFYERFGNHKCCVESPSRSKRSISASSSSVIVSYSPGAPISARSTHLPLRTAFPFIAVFAALSCPLAMARTRTSSGSRDEANERGVELAAGGGFEQRHAATGSRKESRNIERPSARKFRRNVMEVTF
jgi:hypothetical protein